MNKEKAMEWWNNLSQEDKESEICEMYDNIKQDKLIELADEERQMNLFLDEVENGTD